MASRLLCLLPLSQPVPSQELRFERVHKAGLKVAPDVPWQTATSAVLRGAWSLSLSVGSQRQCLSQLARLHENAVGRHLLDRVSTRTDSGHASALQALRLNMSYLISKAPVAWLLDPPWQLHGRACMEIIPRLHRRRACASVMRSMAPDQIEALYPNALHVYANGSQHRGLLSSSVAFFIP